MKTAGKSVFNGRRCHQRRRRHRARVPFAARVRPLRCVCFLARPRLGSPSRESGSTRLALLAHPSGTSTGLVLAHQVDANSDSTTVWRIEAKLCIRVLKRLAPHAAARSFRHSVHGIQGTLIGPLGWHSTAAGTPHIQAPDRCLGLRQCRRSVGFDSSWGRPSGPSRDGRLQSKRCA